MDMGLDTKLINARDKLQRWKANYETELQKNKDEVMVRRGRGEVGPEIDNLERWVKEWAANTEKQIQDLQAEIADLEKQIASKEYQAQKRARAALDNMKGIARSAWLENGGTPEAFEREWPQMEMDILKKRTIESLNKTK